MEVLDNLDIEQENKKPSTLLNVMCILGYVANGFWILISLIVLAAGDSILSEFLPESTVNSEEIITAIYTGFVLFLLLLLL